MLLDTLALVIIREMYTYKKKNREMYKKYRVENLFLKQLAVNQAASCRISKWFVHNNCTICLGSSYILVDY